MSDQLQVATVVAFHTFSIYPRLSAPNSDVSPSPSRYCRKPAESHEYCVSHNRNCNETRKPYLIISPPSRPTRCFSARRKKAPRRSFSNNQICQKNLSGTLCLRSIALPHYPFRAFRNEPYDLPPSTESRYALAASGLPRMRAERSSSFASRSCAFAITSSTDDCGITTTPSMSAAI